MIEATARFNEARDCTRQGVLGLSGSKEIKHMNAKIAKALRLFLGFLILSAIRAPGQGQTLSPTATNLTDSTGYVCVQRGPDSKVWQTATVLTNADGSLTTNYLSYTEIATGLCYSSNGQWLDSVEQVVPVPGGAQAVQGRHQVSWALNANTPGGAVQLTAPSGQQFSSGVYALSYWDADAGTNVLIASLQNSLGFLENNRVVYTNAFSGVNADLEYIYTRAGLEQNVVLREQPPSPADFNLNPQSTFLEVVTEFYNSPMPMITTVTNNGLSDDRILRFDDMLMGQGTAFISGDQTTGHGFGVTKHWLPQANGNAFLIEEVPYTALTNLVGVLPLHSSNIKPTKQIRRTASLNPPPRRPSSGKSAAGVMKIARGGLRDAQKPGLVIDYTLNGSDHASSNFIFQSDTTYFVSGVWSFYGSPGTIVFEGGTVVKYTNNATIYNYGSSVGVFSGSMYRPSVFTSWQDNSVGTPIAGSSGSPSNVPSTTYYIEEAGGGSSSNFISNARFSFADYTYTDYSDHIFTFRDCQFVDCITVTFTPYCNHIYFQNVLCSGNYDVFSGYGGPENIDAENITVDKCTYFALTNSWWGPCTYNGGITNSILTDCDSSTSFFTTNHTEVTSGTGIYTNVGAGGYYLANGTYRGVGTTMINSALQKDLLTKTTYPPLVLSGGANSTNLTSQPIRNTGTPDYGYHYDPLDYALNGIEIDGTVVVEPGTALAMCGSQYGVSLYEVGTFYCMGTAASPNYMVRYNTVQEQSTATWETTGWLGSLLVAVGNSAVANFAFTDWSVLGSDCQVYSQDPNQMGFTNCQFYSGTIYYAGPTISSDNSLYRRVNLQLADSTSSPFLSTFCNNLFLEGSLNYSHSETGTWTFRDNLFDQTLIANQGTAPIDVCSNNAYVTTNNGYLSPTNNAVFLTNSPSYQSGALGQNYYPTNEINLIYKGSQSAAAAGLYHYTVTTNNVIDGTNMVSIGFHYAAVGTNGLQLDSNGEGIPDYIADANGNGIDDPGEIPWNSPYIANPGGEAVLLASLSGGTSYQWEWNGATLCGETSSTLTINPVDATNAGTYTVITTIGGYQTSYTPILLTGPEIIVQPRDYITPYSNNASFSVTAIGSSFTYQWQTNGINVSGATNSLLLVTNATQANADSYTVVLTSQLTNNTYAVTSYYALLGVTEPIIAPTTTAYTSEPTTNVNFPVTVSGSPGLTFQWYKQIRVDSVGSWNSVPLINGFNVNPSVPGTVSGATNSTLTISGLTTSDSGVYRLSAGSSETLDTNVSQEINLYVDPAITSQPRNQIVDVGSNATFTVAAWSAGSLSYQWYSNGSAISGQTNTSVALNDVTTNNAATYTVSVTKSGGSPVFSSNIDGILSVRTPIWLTTKTNYPATNYVTSFYQSYSNNGNIYWYRVQSANDYTSILTSSVPHIVHYDAGTFQTTGEEDWNYNTAQAGWQHWGSTNTNGPTTTIQLLCNSNDSEFNMIFGSGYHNLEPAPTPTPIRTDGFQLHDLNLDCNANNQPQRTNSNSTNTWTGVFTCGNNIVISNVTFIHFGKQGNIENFPLQIIPFDALDENSQLITLYSNITVEDCTFTDPATDNLTNYGGLTTATILPSYGQRPGDAGVILNLTNTVFSNCVITNVQSDFGWTNGFSALSIQNCVVSGCGAAIYFEIGNPVYYGQSFLIQSNYFTNVECGLLVSYNEVSQYPMALGSITLISNVIALSGNQPADTYEAGLAIGFPNNEAAVPEIPSLMAQYNKITTGVPGSPHWGLFVQNLASALVTDNTFDDSFYAISTYSARSMNQDDYALKMPLASLAAERNHNGSQLVEITRWGDTTTVLPIGTQQKGDFNLDGYTDLLWRNMSTGQNVLWPMEGTNTKSCSGPVLSNGLPSMPAGWVVSGTADFTGDCNNDILWTMPGTTNVLLWTMQGPSFICSNWMPALPSGYGIAATGDFNGDGKTDLVLTNSSTNTFLLWLMNGKSILSNVTVSANWPTGTSQIVGAGPFNGGEQADILFRDYASGANTVWVMSGTTYTFVPVTLAATNTNWQIQGVGDFNGDGIADIVWRNPSAGSNVIWLTSSPLGSTYRNVVLTSLAGTSWTIGGPR